MQKTPRFKISLVGVVLFVPVLFIAAYYVVLWKIHGFNPRFLDIDACVNAGGIWTEEGECDASASLHPLQDRIADLIRAGETVRVAPSWVDGQGVIGYIAERGYAIGDVSFAVALQPNVHTPVSGFKEGAWYGILARRGNGVSEQFLTYSRPEEDGREVKMNPVDISVENGQLVVSLVDDRGAGSGEGNLLRLASADGGWTWGVDGCFYYTPETYAANPKRLPVSKECLIPYVPGLLGAGPEEVVLTSHPYRFEEIVHENVGEAVCEIEGSYPEIQPTSGLSEDTRTAMNAMIASHVVEALSGFGEGKEAAADPSTAAQAFVGSCVTSLKDLAKQDPSTTMWAGWYSELFVQTELNAGGYLSLVFSHNFYTGGAHPNTITSALSFSLATGAKIGWQEWVEKDRVIDFTKAVAEGVVSVAEEDMFSEQAELYQVFLRNPTREQAEMLLNTYGEYIPTEAGVRVLFDPYEIASYAAGPIEFTIPRSELRGVILF